MLEPIRKRIHNIKRQIIEKTQQRIKKNQFLHQCLICIGLSIFLGLGFKYGYDSFISVIKPSLDTLHISSVSQVDNSYLFSTSAAILSTIFTIIFVLLTVFIQLSGSNVSSVDILKSKETKYLIVLYFSTIILSLMMLETTFQFPILVLTLTFACIFIIYYFLLYIGNEIMYEVMPGKLYTEISSNILFNNEPPACIGAMSLSKICEASIKDNRFGDFLTILGIYKRIAEMANENRMMEVIHIIGADYSILFETLLKEKPTKSNRNGMLRILGVRINVHVSKYSDISNSNLSNSLFVWGPLNTITAKIKDGVKEDNLNSQVIILCYRSFKELNKGDVYDNEMDESIIESLGELAKESYKHKLDRSLAKSIGVLFTIGVKAYKRDTQPEYLIALVINALKEIKEYIGLECFEKIYSNFKDIVHIS